MVGRLAYFICSFENVCVMVQGLAFATRKTSSCMRQSYGQDWIPLPQYSKTQGRSLLVPCRGTSNAKNSDGQHVWWSTFLVDGLALFICILPMHSFCRSGRHGHDSAKFHHQTGISATSMSAMLIRATPPIPGRTSSGRERQQSYLEVSCSLLTGEFSYQPLWLLNFRDRTSQHHAERLRSLHVMA